MQTALCCSGKLTRVSLVHMKKLWISCLNVIMKENPHLHTLSLGFVSQFEDGKAKASFLIYLELPLSRMNVGEA